VVRRSTGAILYDTSLPGFVYADQFIQIPAKLPHGVSLYGLGENDQPRYRHDLRKWRTWTGWTREQQPEFRSNMYGVHPTYTAVELDGNTHGLLMLNSNAQEWSTTPQPGFVYRTIGGIVDFYFFLGPSPGAVNRQYTEAVGRYPVPPYWSLGYQVSGKSI